MQQWLKGLAAAGAFWAALAGAAEDAKPIASDAPPDALEAAVTRMARIAVRPAWVGVLDFNTRQPGPLRR